jgi:hypothetical protein
VEKREKFLGKNSRNVFPASQRITRIRSRKCVLMKITHSLESFFGSLVVLFLGLSKTLTFSILIRDWNVVSSSL